MRNTVPQSQFLQRNRHNNIWYGRVIIPSKLRPIFGGKRELKRSLRTADKHNAKFLSLRFWVQCQEGFTYLLSSSDTHSFTTSQDYLDWLKNNKGQSAPMKLIEVETYGGGKFKIDFDDPKEEAKLALQLQANEHALYKQLQNDPARLAHLDRIKSEYQLKGDSLPETVITFNEAADLYIERLRNHGRKGRKLAPRTIAGYEERLNFWKEVFADRHVHEILLRELGEIQDWLPWIRPNYKKRKDKSGKPFSTKDAITHAKTSRDAKDHISEKTLADYLGQLKAVL